MGRIQSLLPWLLGSALFAGCATPPPAPPSQCPEVSACAPCPACPGAQAPAPPPAEPLQAARWDDLPGWQEDDPRPALSAFVQSCKVLGKQPAWQQACAEAATLTDEDAAAVRRFFESRFAPYQVVNPDGSREGLITGYYEPLLKGSRKRSARFSHAIYGVPDDLLVVDLGDLYPDLKDYRLRGRLDGRKVVPYYSRAELSQRDAQLAAKALLWVADPVELFFLQVQGSGRVELENGRRVRVGYAEHNGHPYRSIGRHLVEQGELRLEQASMQGIQAWARAHPQRLQNLLDSNPSYVFFRDLGSGDSAPSGALGVPLTEGHSLAVDRRVITLGAPVYLATTLPASTRALRRLMLAQDTGGAIKGAVRADFFWGFGAAAGAQAGKMRQQGMLWVLLPPAAAPR